MHRLRYASKCGDSLSTRRLRSVAAQPIGGFGSPAVLDRPCTPEVPIADRPTVQPPAEPGCRLDLARPDVSTPVEVATLVADRTRAGILKLLATGPCCVCEIAAALDERPNNVSNHLAQLRRAGLVHAVHHEADARRAYYELDRAACAAALEALRVLLEG